MTEKPTEIAAAWWRSLQPYLSDGRRNPAADRGALADLRRASVVQAMDHPATHGLFHALGYARPRDITRAALCAAVLASVRENDARLHPARALGPASSDAPETAVMSPLRFRRLMEAMEPEDRLIALRRAVMLAGRTLHVRFLAGACLAWSDRTRRDWIFQYYNAGFAAPDADETVLEGDDA